MAEQCETARTANIKEFKVVGQYVDVPNLKLPVIFARYEYLRSVVSRPESDPKRDLERDRRELASYAFELYWRVKDESDPAAQLDLAALDLAAPGVDFYPIVTSAIDDRVGLSPEARLVSGIEIGVVDPGVLVGEAVSVAPAAQLTSMNYNRLR